MSERLRRPWGDVRGFLLAVARGAWRAASARLRDLYSVRRLFSAGTLGSFRGASELLEAFRRGGVVVVTPDRAGQAAASTLVAPDGDLVSRVSPATLLDPELWRRHQQAVSRRVEPLTRVSAMVRALSGLLAVAGAALGAYVLGSAGVAATAGLDALGERLVELWVEIRWPVAGGAVAGGAHYALGLWLRGKVEQLLG